MNDIRIGDLVRVATTTEALVLIAIDGEEAFVRYDEGTHKVVRVEDLERVHSKAWYQANPTIQRINHVLQQERA